MKHTSFGLLATLTLTTALAACATPDSLVGTSNEYDYAKAAAIDRAAQRYGVKVYWINYPQKRQTISSAAVPAGS
jgi:hypothetical protein